MNDATNKFKGGTKVDFVTEQEPFCSYQIADGHRLKVKHVVTEVRRLPDENGEPVFGFDYQSVIKIEKL